MSGIRAHVLPIIPRSTGAVLFLQRRGRSGHFPVYASREKHVPGLFLLGECGDVPEYSEACLFLFPLLLMSGERESVKIFHEAMETLFVSAVLYLLR